MTVDQFALALAVHYSQDPIAPGLQIAYLNDKASWYICVHRFPTRSVSNREFVCKALLPKFEETLDLCFSMWKESVDRLAAAKAAALANDPQMNRAESNGEGQTQ